MKKIILLFVIIIFWVMGLAQTPNWQWAKGMGSTYDDEANTITVDGVGNIYTIGFFSGTVDFDPGSGIFNLTSSSSGDVFILKLNSSGNFVWAKQFRGKNNDYGESIAVDILGNVYVTGHFGDTTDFDPGIGVFNLVADSILDVFICKLDSSGNFIWARAMGGPGWDYGFSIAIDNSCNVYITGAFRDTADFDPDSIGTFNLISAGGADIFVCKIDSSGNFLWAKGMGGKDNDFGLSIALDPSGSGGIYTTGFFKDTADFDPGAGVFAVPSVWDYDIFISKLDSAGNFLWAKGICGKGDDRGESVALDPSGNGDVYITGWFEDTVDFDPGIGTFNLVSASTSFDSFVLKLDSSGNLIWAKATGGYYGWSIAADILGNAYIVGHFGGTSDFDPGTGTFILSSVGGSADIFVSKLDASGNFVWAKAAGGASNDLPQSLAIDASNDVYITGYFTSPSILFNNDTLVNQDTAFPITGDIFVAKLDAGVGINEMKNLRDIILVFPNPATTSFTISDLRFTISEIEIYNTLGEVVQNYQLPIINHQLTVDVSQLLPGVYFVAVTDDKGNKITRKFVKM